jgi:hypothetical protein
LNSAPAFSGLVDVFVVSFELDANGIVPFAVKTGRPDLLLGGDINGTPGIDVSSACVLETHCKVAEACAFDVSDKATKSGFPPKLCAV